MTALFKGLPSGRQLLLRAADKGIWALMDQGVVSVANFVLNLLLARWLAASQYGAYGVAFAVFLLLGTFHTSLFSEPMLVFGAGRYSTRFSSYLRVLLQGHVLFSGAIAALFLVAALVLRQFGADVWAVVATLALASPLILFQWLMRRACYAALRPRRAALAALVYFAAVMAGAYAMYRVGVLTAPVALLLMGMASAISGGLILLRFDRPHDGALKLAAVAREHWTFGRWSVGSAGLKWLQSYIYYFILPAFAGLAAAGSLRVLSTMLMPISQANAALGTLLLPMMVRRRASASFGRSVAAIATVLATAAVAYYAVLLGLGGWLMHLAFGDKYHDVSPLLAIYGLAPILSAVAGVLASALQALVLPSRVFVATLVSASAAVTLGTVLVMTLGLTGAVLGDVVSLAAMVVFLALDFRSRHAHMRGTQAD